MNTSLAHAACITSPKPDWLPHFLCTRFSPDSVFVYSQSSFRMFCACQVHLHHICNVNIFLIFKNIIKNIYFLILNYSNIYYILHKSCHLWGSHSQDHLFKYGSPLRSRFFFLNYHDLCNFWWYRFYAFSEHVCLCAGHDLFHPIRQTRSYQINRLNNCAHVSVLSWQLLDYHLRLVSIARNLPIITHSQLSFLISFLPTCSQAKCNKNTKIMTTIYYLLVLLCLFLENKCYFCHVSSSVNQVPCYMA